MAKGTLAARQNEPSLQTKSPICDVKSTQRTTQRCFAVLKVTQQVNLNSIFFSSVQSDRVRTAYNGEEQGRLSYWLSTRVHAHGINRVTITFSVAFQFYSVESSVLASCNSLWGRSSFCLFLYDLVNIDLPRTEGLFCLFIQICLSVILSLSLEQSVSLPLFILFFFPSSGEAVGHLLCVLKQNSLLLSVQSQADKAVRSLWAQPSVGGAHVVATVLSNPAHLVEWWVTFHNLVFKKCGSDGSIAAVSVDVPHWWLDCLGQFLCACKASKRLTGSVLSI